MNISLGKLKEVNIRDVWKHEQYDFSKWLSSPENIQELSDTIGLSLTDIETEKFVGSYRCDIICKDEITGKNVLIENQLEPSNHDHLGKIITYASGLDAAVVVWIVQEAREEHASAIEWLNKHTGDDLAFFLIEIHAFTIGDSKTAPQFRIIQQPNEFAKMVKEISKNTDLNESQTYRLEFWNMFNNVIEERGKTFNKHKPSTDHWYTVAIGSSKCHISIDLVNKENRIRVGLWIQNSKDLFDKLLVERENIENEANIQFEWDRLDTKKASLICTYLEGLDFENQSNYKDLMNQIIDYVVVFKKVFSKYI